MNFMYVFASILIIFMINNDGCVNSQSISVDQTDILNLKKTTEKPYKFHPEERRLEADEGDGYTISFEEVSNKTHFVNCYYESTTIKGNYVIKRQFEEASTSYHPYPYHQNLLYLSEMGDIEQFLEQPDDNSRDQRISLQKNKGPTTNTFKTDSTTCGFALGNINSKAPRLWTITAFDSYSKKNYTEIVSIYFYYNAPLAYKEIYALAGSSYFNYLRINSKIPLQNCVLTHDGMVFDLELYDNTQQSEYDITWKGLGDGRCGYIVSDAKLNNPLNITLRAIGRDKIRNYRNTSLITIIDKSYFFKNREIFTSPTDNIVVHCGISYEPSRIQSPERFCNLFDPRGKFVHSGDTCSYHIKHVNLDDFGIWSCTVGPSHSMDTLSFKTSIKQWSLSQELKVDSYVSEHGKYFSLICEVLNVRTNETLFCKFTRPDGQIFTTYRGAASPLGYLSYSTNLDEGICGIDIPIPVHSEDKGTWKCEISTLSFKTGTFIDFMTSSTPILTQKPSPRPVAVGEKFAVKCMVGFSANNCYIISPNGTHFESEEQYAWFAGECGLTVRHASVSDNGTWTCFFTRDSTIVDHGVNFNIMVANTERDKEFPIRVVSGGSFIINCFNSHDIPLEYCRLFSPSGDGYSFNGTKTTVKHLDMAFRYIGKGLEFGDCIVHLRNVTGDKADGIWTCSFKIRNIAKTYTHTYDVSVYFENNRVYYLFLLLSAAIAPFAIMCAFQNKLSGYSSCRCCAGCPIRTQNADNTEGNVELEVIPAPRRARAQSFPEPRRRFDVAYIDIMNLQEETRF